MSVMHLCEGVSTTACGGQCGPDTILCVCVLGVGRTALCTVGCHKAAWLTFPEGTLSLCPTSGLLELSTGIAFPTRKGWTRWA